MDTQMHHYLTQVLIGPPRPVGPRGARQTVLEVRRRRREDSRR